MAVYFVVGGSILSICSQPPWGAVSRVISPLDTIGILVLQTG